VPSYTNGQMLIDLNLIDPTKLLPTNGKETLLGERSNGPCLLRHHTRLNVQVVEQQSLMYDTKEMLKEAQIMQTARMKIFLS